MHDRRTESLDIACALELLLVLVHRAGHIDGQDKHHNSAVLQERAGAFADGVAALAVGVWRGRYGGSIR